MGSQPYAQAKICEIDLIGDAANQTLDLKLESNSALVTQFDSIEDKQDWRDLKGSKFFMNLDIDHALNIDYAPF